jgi:hypothetical protein
MVNTNRAVVDKALARPTKNQGHKLVITVGTKPKVPANTQKSDFFELVMIIFALMMRLKEVAYGYIDLGKNEDEKSQGYGVLKLANWLTAYLLLQSRIDVKSIIEREHYRIFECQILDHSFSLTLTNLRTNEHFFNEIFANVPKTQCKVQTQRQLAESKIPLENKDELVAEMFRLWNTVPYEQRMAAENFVVQMKKRDDYI